MERRKFMLGMGSLAAGGAAAMGTGAFSSVSASRGMNVNVSSDENAYLQIKGDPDYTSQTNGTLQVDIQNNGRGSGLNGNATTEFTDLLLVRNQGTENVLVWLNLNDLNAQIGPDPSTNDGQYVTSYLSMDSYGAGMDGGDGTSSGQGTSGAPGAWGVFLAPGKRAEIALGFYDVPEDDIGSMYEADIGVNAAAVDSEYFKNVVPNYTFPSEGTSSVDFIN
ncbi:hypothetical protein ACFO0N_17675 [Halobium salinum]|uniref:DUF1102 domain-containing protein n=1 Tax=Halobium salinum TaxID=1364940 RepID=A0ABD5PGA9_9EURY|nr:hypothetical protein [Halobium salinum]